MIVFQMLPTLMLRCVPPALIYIVIAIGLKKFIKVYNTVKPPEYRPFPKYRAPEYRATILSPIFFGLL